MEIRALFYKEDLEKMSKEKLQEKLNEYIDTGFLPPDTTLDNVGIYEPTKKHAAGESTTYQAWH